MLEARWVDKQKVAFDAGLVDFDGALGVDLNNADAAGRIDSIQLVLASAVQIPVDFTVLHEVFVFNFLKVSQSLIWHLPFGTPPWL